MSSCCSTFRAGTAEQFDTARAEGDLRRYAHRGPIPTTRLLRDGIVAAGGGTSLLDIGGGIGALSLELLARGFERATMVDASPAYLAVARRAAGERGLGERVEFHEGDFVDRAAAVRGADAVALDRVVCCYPDFARLLDAAAGRSRRIFALSYPRDRWFVRAVVTLGNSIRRWTKRAFRTFVHPEAGMAGLLAARGFHRVSRRETLAWCADVYVRTAAPR